MYLLVLMQADMFDAGKAATLIKKQQTKATERKLALLEARYQMFQILTDEQKTQYSELKKQHHKR